MAEPDHGDRPVTAQSTEQTAATQASAPRKAQRRRASRPAGPPQDVTAGPPQDVVTGASSGISVSPAAPSGKPRRTTGTPVKSAPLGRKPKAKDAIPVPADRPVSMDKAEADPPAVEVSAAETSGVDGADSPEAETGVQSFGSTSVKRGVSYRDRRRGGRGSDLREKRSRRNGSGGSAGKNASPRSRGNLRGLGIVLAAVVAIGLISGMVVASTLFVMGTNKIDERNDLRAEYSAFARQMIINLTTLNPDNIDGAIKSFQDSTSGKAMEQAGQSMEQTVNMIKSDNVSAKGTVISDAVLDGGDALPGQEPLKVDGKIVPRPEMTDNEASVILVYSWEMNQPNVPDQQTVLQTFRVKLDITRINGQLKLTNFEWVT